MPHKTSNHDRSDTPYFDILNKIRSLFNTINSRSRDVFWNLVRYKSKKALLRKIVHQNIDDNDKEFIISLPSNELKKLRERIIEIGDELRFEAWMIRNTHRKEQAAPDIKNIIARINYLNSLLKYISEKRNIEFKNIETDDLLPKE